MATSHSNDEARRLTAARALLVRSKAIEQAGQAIADMRDAALAVMRQELDPARHAELERFLDAYSHPESAAVAAYMDGLSTAFTNFCVERFELSELASIDQLQGSEKFQALAPELAASVQAPLRSYQTKLVAELNKRFR